MGGGRGWCGVDISEGVVGWDVRKGLWDIGVGTVWGRGKSRDGVTAFCGFGKVRRIVEGEGEGGKERENEGEKENQARPKTSFVHLPASISITFPPQQRKSAKI